jgi:hypothetical protein
MSRKDPRRALPLPVGPALRGRLRAAAPFPEPLAATVRRLIRAALDAGHHPSPLPAPDPGPPLALQLAPAERAALAAAAATLGLTEADAARSLLFAALDAREALAARQGGGRAAPR